jgi:hypothetical protein
VREYERVNESNTKRVQYLSSKLEELKNERR